MTMTVVKVRLYPNKNQEEQIWINFNHTRSLWNKLLGLQMERYENSKDNESAKRSAYLGGYDMAILLPLIKQENPWMNEADSRAMQEVTTNLDLAFKRFFKKTSGYPRFRSWKRSKQAYTTKQRLQLVGENHLKLPKLGPVKFKQKFIPEGRLKRATVSISATGNYYASVVIEREIEPLPKTGKSVGIDLGLASLSTQSDGTKIPLPRFDKNLARKKRNWERKLARRRIRALSVIHEQKKLGHTLELEDLANYTRAKYMVAKYSEKERNQRNDYHQKYTTKLVKEFDTIVIEDLKPSNLVKNHKLARAVANAGWRSLRTMLEYKTSWYGKELIVINPAYTSQVDFETGEIQKKGLKIREYVNSNGTLVDRDVNAAKNILKWGLYPETRVTKA